MVPPAPADAPSPRQEALSTGKVSAGDDPMGGKKQKGGKEVRKAQNPASPVFRKILRSDGRQAPAHLDREASALSYVCSNSKL